MIIGADTNLDEFDDVKDEGAAFGLTDPDGMNVHSEFRVTHHKVFGVVGAEARNIAAKATAFKLIIKNDPAHIVPVDFEINSITFVFRDLGVKG